MLNGMNINKFISDRCELIDGTAINKVTRLATENSQLVNLAVGQPDFKISHVVKESAISAIRDDKNTYSSAYGISALRKQVLLYHQVFGPSFLYNNIDCVITCGVTAGLSLALATCLDAGDDLLISDPYFQQYSEIIKLFSINPVFIDTYPDFHLTADKIKNAITPRTKGIIINSPGNPTGAVIGSEEMNKIQALVEEKDILIFYDNIYSNFDYTGAQASIELSDHVIYLNGFSKSYAMTGWRIGYVVAHERFVERIARVQSQLYDAPPTPLQYAAVEALKSKQDIQHYKEYNQRIAYINNELHPAYKLNQGQGAFYVFPFVPNKFESSATDFCAHALSRNLLLVPGKAFSNIDTNFRLSICANFETIQKGTSILNEIAQALY